MAQGWSTIANHLQDLSAQSCFGKMMGRITIAASFGISAVASVSIPPIIDTHVHNADISHINYNFEAMFPDLIQNWTMSQFTQAATANPKATMRGAILMELDKVDLTQAVGLQEAAFFQAAAEKCDSLPTGECVPVLGIVATAPIHDGGDVMRNYLVELLRVAPRVRAVRQAIWKKGTDFFLSDAFEEGLRELAQYNLPFDVLVKNWQLKDFAVLAQKVPEIKFNLNHIGYPDIVNGTEESSQSWKDDISTLAALPNVYSNCLASRRHTRNPSGWTTGRASYLTSGTSLMLSAPSASTSQVIGLCSTMTAGIAKLESMIVFRTHTRVLSICSSDLNALQLSAEDMESIFAGTAIELYHLDNADVVV